MLQNFGILSLKVIKKYLLWYGLFCVTSCLMMGITALLLIAHTCSAVVPPIFFLMCELHCFLFKCCFWFVIFFFFQPGLLSLLLNLVPRDYKSSWPDLPVVTYWVLAELSKCQLPTRVPLEAIGLRTAFSVRNVYWIFIRPHRSSFVRYSFCSPLFPSLLLSLLCLGDT